MTRPGFDAPTTTDVEPTDKPSPLAAELVASGAAPVEADPHEIMRQLQAQVERQQRVIEQLAAERGVPTNPRQAFAQALVDHARLQANANPAYVDDYKELREFLDEVLKNVDSLSMNHVDYLREVIDELREKHPQHELAYIATLARDLRKLLLSEA